MTRIWFNCFFFTIYFWYSSKKPVFTFADLGKLLFCTHLGRSRCVGHAAAIRGKRHQPHCGSCYFSPFVWRQTKTAQFLLKYNFLLALEDLLNFFFIRFYDIVPQFFSLLKQLLRLLLDVLSFRLYALEFFEKMCLFRFILLISTPLLCTQGFLCRISLLFSLRQLLTTLFLTISHLLFPGFHTLFMSQFYGICPMFRYRSGLPSVNKLLRSFLCALGMFLFIFE